MYGITRIDNNTSHTHSWVVTIARKRRKFVKSFSDVPCGGKGKALRAAKKYRDEILSQFPPLTLNEYCSIVKRNNRSGIPGVCLYLRPNKDGQVDRYWIACWSPTPRKTKQVKFSVKKYGEEEAFQRAVQARSEALKKLAGFFNPGMSNQRHPDYR